MKANTTNRPGNMENVFENRNNTEMFGKIVAYEDKYKTLTIELSDGSTKSMTWSTFKGAWRKKAHTEMPAEETVEDQLKEEGFSEEEVEEITASVECGRTLDVAMQNVIEKREENDDEYIAEIMQQKKNLGIEVPAIDSIEIVSETRPEMKPVPKRGALIEYNGKSQNICAWGRELNMSANTLYNRIYAKGMSVEEAFTTPVKKRGNK